MIKRITKKTQKKTAKRRARPALPARDAGCLGPPIHIDREFRELVPALTREERDELERSLLAEGCRHELVVWRQTGILLDGHQRHEIYRQHARDTKPIALPRVVEISLPDRQAAREWIIHNQLARRNLTPMQRVELALKLKPAIVERAKERQRLSEGRGKKGIQKSGDLSRDQERRTDKELARLAGVSHDTVAKGERVLAEADDLTKERLRRGESTISREYDRLVKPQAPPRRVPVRDHVRTPGDYLPKRQSASRLQAILNMLDRIEKQLDVPADKMIKAGDDLFHHIAAQNETIEELKSKWRYGIPPKDEGKGGTKVGGGGRTR